MYIVLLNFVVLCNQLHALSDSQCPPENESYTVWMEELACVVITSLDMQVCM